MYILLNNNTVSEIIPDIDPVFPGIPIGSRYTAKFVAQLLHVEDDVEVQQNWVYDPESGVFSEPPEPVEPAPEPEPVEPAPEPEPEPSADEILDALLGVSE